MKLHVNQFDFTGDIATDLQNGLITAFDDADHLMTSDDAINKLVDGAKVAGVSAPNDQSAKRVYDGVRRMRTFKIHSNDSQPAKLHAYDSFKERLSDGWKLFTDDKEGE